MRIAQVHCFPKALTIWTLSGIQCPQQIIIIMTIKMAIMTIIIRLENIHDKNNNGRNNKRIIIKKKQLH